MRYLDPLYVHDFKTIQRERLKEFRQRLWRDLGGDELAAPNDDTFAELRWNARYALVARNEYDDDWYRSLFDECDAAKITGDFSPDYSLLPRAGIANLARLLPNARLVFIARDPIERALSGATYVLRFQKSLTAEEAQKEIRRIALSPLQFRFSDYQRILKDFTDLFGPERILVIFHDQIILDPHGVLEAVCRHVSAGYNSAFSPSPLETNINRSPRYDIDDETTMLVAKKLRMTVEWMAEHYGGAALDWRSRYGF